MNMKLFSSKEKFEFYFHGTKREITHTLTSDYKSKYTLDFGNGFYCTRLQQQAITWADKNQSPGLVYLVEVKDYSHLNVKRFLDVDKGWLDFIANCRADAQFKHGFDVVIGPMADDTIWDFVSMYLEGSLPESAFLELAKFKKPTHQICFCSQEALDLLNLKEIVYDSRK